MPQASAPGRTETPVPADPSRGPLLDLRVRWRAGHAALALAALLGVVAFLRPFSPGASPRLRLAMAVLLGLGVAASALLASLKGRGRGEALAFYGFLGLCLDAFGQLLSPLGWPSWPLLALLVAAVSVAEPPAVGLALAGLAAAFGFADAASGGPGAWKAAGAAAAGYLALSGAVSLALAGEKRRLAATLAELARVKQGIDLLEGGESGAPVRPSPVAQVLRQVSQEGRRARQADRAAELDATLARLVRVARTAVGAHSMLYFQVDRERDSAYLRAHDGAPAVLADARVDLGQDPFAFVLDRRQPFYATDFPRLLWSLPYYRGEVKVGSLLAVPVRTVDVVAGVLVADRLEIQALTGREPELVDAFAELAADAILQARESESREETTMGFRAAYGVSRSMTVLESSTHVRRLLLSSAQDLVPLQGAAVVIADEAQTRYLVENAVGWAAAFEGREVGLTEKTWTAWLLRSAEESTLLDDVAGAESRMPILVLDEGTARAESLLAFPLRVRNRTLGALVLTGRRGVFDTRVSHVLGLLANQAAAALFSIRSVEREKQQAMRDGLTGLYNRRAFDELFRAAIGQQDRHGGSLALLLLDLDHFKKLNDTFGHPAGDAALRSAAEVLRRHLRRGDVAARYGGEEFVVILPGTDAAGGLQLAERVRGAIAAHQLVFEGARLSVTASFGAAVWPGDGREAEALLAAADRALYAAKQAGRNRVVAAATLASEAAALGREPGPA